ncbi:anaerobic ribonucleoside-triphosphate reductase activating protein [Candidatus Bathyarchaeota archaeon]|nr:anaerobic ribonucleoside-triphosphate reductase activating protein [Candidatus Bathyarchaeota archaeon]
MRFAGFQKTSLIDYPDRVASVLFTAGCNLRCPYCHNGDLVHGYRGPFLEAEDVLAQLVERRRYVDAVVVTGGEPTMNPDLPVFLKELNKQGFAVKLDTNGLKPEAVRSCLPLIDYVAMDVKTSPGLYASLGAEDVTPVAECIRTIMGSGVDYEFRCTAVPGFVEEETVAAMGEMVRGAKRFVFQQFRPEKTLDPSYNEVKPHPEDKIKEFAEIMKDYVDDVLLRI